MKRIGRIKLTQLSKVELEKRGMNTLRGGMTPCCNCTCFYEPVGGASTASNLSANNVSDLSGVMGPGMGGAN